jgi:hypothetical protein
MLKEIKEDLNKWKDISCSRIGGLNVIKMAVLPKLIHKFNTTSIKITFGFFTETDQLT